MSVVTLMLSTANIVYSQVKPGKTMSVDPNSKPGNSKANTSNNQSLVEEKVYCFGYATTRKAGIMTKEEQAEHPDGYVDDKILYISNVVEAIRNGKAYENPRTDLFEYWGSFFHGSSVTKQKGKYFSSSFGWSDLQSVNNKRAALISEFTQKGFEVRYIDNFFIKQKERITSGEIKETAYPTNQKIQLSSGSGTTASKEKEEDFWSTPENKTTKQEVKQKEELKRKEQQQENARQLESAKQTPYILNGVSNRDTVYENSMQLIQSLNPGLKDAIVTISWTNSKTNQSTTLTGIDNRVTLTEGWNKFNIAVWVNNTPIKSLVTLYYSKNGSGMHNGTVTDKDGNIYKTVTIGTQTWMAENLRTTKYNDGSAIPNVTDNTEWKTQTAGAYCWYDNDISNKATYGALYNFYTVVDSRKLCPTGWHVPSYDEWTQLIDFAGTDHGRKLKSRSEWHSYGNGTDDFNFSGMPGGCRFFNVSFYNIGETSDWWSSTEESACNIAWHHYIYYKYNTLSRNKTEKNNGFSVRCIKNK